MRLITLNPAPSRLYPLQVFPPPINHWQLNCSVLASVYMRTQAVPKCNLLNENTVFFKSYNCVT